MLFCFLCICRYLRQYPLTLAKFRARILKMGLLGNLREVNVACLQQLVGASQWYEPWVKVVVCSWHDDFERMLTNSYSYSKITSRDFKHVSFS